MLHALLETIQGLPQQERYIPQHVLEVKWSQGCMGGMALTLMKCLLNVTVYVLHVQQERMGQLAPPAPRALVGLTVRLQASQPAPPAVLATMLEQKRHYAVLAALARTRPRERHCAVLAVPGQSFLIRILQCLQRRKIFGLDGRVFVRNMQRLQYRDIFSYNRGFLIRILQRLQCWNIFGSNWSIFIRDM